MLRRVMPDQDDSLFGRKPEAEVRFRRSLIKWTITYAAVLYVLLTLRSLAIGNPYLGLQAALRIPMILIGIALCGAIHVLLTKVEARPLKARLAVAAAAAAAATLAFSTAAYILYLVIPGIWPDERGVIPSLGYYSFQFMWIFPVWIVIRFYLRYQIDADDRRREDGFVEEFWPRHLGRQIRVAVEDVEWIEAERDYVRLHVADRSYLIRSTMRHIARRLDPHAFVRIHRRSIVARRAVMCIHRSQAGTASVELRSGVVLPVGRSYASGLKANGFG